MNKRAIDSEFSRIEAITSEFLLALRESGVQNAYQARNLVLDYYATEREFIRLFQQKIDARLASPIAKCWDLAVNADHDWAYRDMTNHIIEHFDDEWATLNRVVATRIMQSVGKWKRLSADPAWEARIIEHLTLPSTNSDSRMRTINNTPSSTYPFKAAVSERNRSISSLEKPPPILQSVSHPTPTPAPTRHPASSKRRGTGLAHLLGFLLFPTAMAIVRFVGNQPQTTQHAQNPSTTIYSQDKSNAALRELRSRLDEYQRDFENARIVCELDSISSGLQSLAADAKQLNSQAVLDESELLNLKAQDRIKKIKQPGKEQYWESCQEGIGFQRYDKYEWVYGEDFSSRFFGIAKKGCLNPAIRFNVYADKDKARLLHSQWVGFTPNATTGIADNLRFSVPAEALPKKEGSYIWWDYEVKCNHQT